MEPVITTMGATIGLIAAIALIILKLPAIYSMILGALIGGVIGGAGLIETIGIMVIGAEGMMATVLRVLTAGVLAGGMIQSGAAEKISNTIITRFGENRAILSMALATAILTAVGVFGDIAVITVAPIAMTLGRKLGISPLVLMTALMGGEKAGMVISPNPQAIAISEGLDIDLITLMYANIIPAIVGLIATVVIASALDKSIRKKQPIEQAIDVEEVVAEDDSELPSLLGSLSGPVIVMVLLALRPLAGIEIDPMIALPIGGIVGIILMGKVKHTFDYLGYGVAKMTPIASLLIGTGTIAGIIRYSHLTGDMTSFLASMNMSSLLAPISTVVMAGATSSSSAGAAIAVQSFGDSILSFTTPLAGGAMMHAGSIVFDALPHGSIFHASAGVLDMSINDRLKVMPYEILIGIIITITSTIIFTMFA